MRKQFPGYFTPNEKEFASMWNTGVFSFDANVLLHLYRYTKPTSERLLHILTLLQARCWLTNQASAEFLGNRLSVIHQQYDAYDFIESNMVQPSLTGIVTQIKNKYPKHSGLDVIALEKIISEAQAKLKVALQVAKKDHPDPSTEDLILNRVAKLFDGKVGEPYLEGDLQLKYKLVQARYDRKQPPGFADLKTKDDDRKYGDAILWLQLLDYAKQEQKPIIFVSDDRKEDWWYEYHGRTISARPELVYEMQQVAGVPFFMYKPERFMEYAEKHFDLPKLPKAIEEARQISQQILTFDRDITFNLAGDAWNNDSDIYEDLDIVDAANYGWTEFWNWARARGFNDRKSLDAIVGRPTNGMTPLEIRRQILHKSGPRQQSQRQIEWNRLITWLREIGINSKFELERALGYDIEDMTPTEIRDEITRRNIDINF